MSKTIYNLNKIYYYFYPHKSHSSANIRSTMKRLLFILPLIAIISFSCVTSRSLSKKATVLEEAGEYTAAADLFYLSIQKKPTNTDAIIGLKRTGKKVLADYLKIFSEKAIKEEYQDATYAYLDAVRYQIKLEQVRVKVEIPSNSQEKYKEVLNLFLTKKYENGLKLINIEQFSEAEKCFNEIYKFDKSFKDVAELRNIAYLEPFYRKAQEQKSSKLYRDAYYSYKKILDRVGDYKETKKSMKYVLAKGRMYITLSNVPNKAYSRYSNSVKQNVINSILKINDPFIKIVERDDINRVLKEQELALNGMSNSRMEIGEIAGAKYSVVIDVTNYSVSSTPLRSENIQGLEEYSEKYYDKENEKYRYRTKYKKVYYREYNASRDLIMSVSYKIISLSTAEIVATDIINRSFNTRVHYITYSGNKKKLHPTNNGKYTSGRNYRSLQNLLKAPRTLKPVGQLIEEFNSYSGILIANNIVNKLK